MYAAYVIDQRCKQHLKLYAIHLRKGNFAREKILGNFGEKVLQNSDTFFAKKQFCEFVANHSLINTT
jgi:hypothetical protein